MLGVNTFCRDDLQPPPEGYETESGGVFAERDGGRISIRTVLLNVNREIAENTHDPGNEFTVRIGENPDGDELIFNVSANEDLDWPAPGSSGRQDSENPVTGAASIANLDPDLRTALGRVHRLVADLH